MNSKSQTLLVQLLFVGNLLTDPPPHARVPSLFLLIFHCGSSNSCFFHIWLLLVFFIGVVGWCWCCCGVIDYYWILIRRYSYGAFWASFAAYVQFIVPKLPADTAHEATGLFLLAWTIFTVCVCVCRGKGWVQVYVGASVHVHVHEWACMRVVRRTNSMTALHDVCLIQGITEFVLPLCDFRDYLHSPHYWCFGVCAHTTLIYSPSLPPPPSICLYVLSQALLHNVQSTLTIRKRILSHTTRAYSFV